MKCVKHVNFFFFIQNFISIKTVFKLQCPLLNLVLHREHYRLLLIILRIDLFINFGLFALKGKEEYFITGWYYEHNIYNKEIEWNISKSTISSSVWACVCSVIIVFCKDQQIQNRFVGLKRKIKWLPSSKWYVTTTTLITAWKGQINCREKHEIISNEWLAGTWIQVHRKSSQSRSYSPRLPDTVRPLY